MYLLFSISNLFVYRTRRFQFFYSNICIQNKILYNSDLKYWKTVLKVVGAKCSGFIAMTLRYVFCYRITLYHSGEKLSLSKSYRY
jgi:hypothetical protein